MIVQVNQVFEDWLRQRFGTSPDVLRFLLEHGRKGRCVLSICGQIEAAERCNIGGRFEVSRFKLLIESCAEMFASAALKFAEEQAISQAERQRRVAEAGYLDEIRDEFRELRLEDESQRLTSRPGSVAK